MKTFTKRDLVVLDVVRAGYARSQGISRKNGHEKGELHGITIRQYNDYLDGTAMAYVRSRVGNEPEEEVVFLEKIDGRWTPRAVEHYDGTLRIDISIEGDQIVFGKETIQ